MIVSYEFAVHFISIYLALHSGCILTSGESSIDAVTNDDTNSINRSIANRARIDTIDKYGMTALHWAVACDNYEFVKILLAYHADVNAKDFFLNTPLHYCDNLKIMKLLLSRGADYAAINLARKQPFELSNVKDKIGSIMKKENIKVAKLFKASAKGDIQAARLLLNDGLNINVKYKGRMALFDAIVNGQKEFSKWLVSNGAYVGKFPELAIQYGINLPDGVGCNLELKKAEKRVHEWFQVNPLEDEIANEQKENGGLTWEAYYTLDEIYSFLKNLVIKYPNLCKLIVIGKTHEGKDLLVLNISNGNSRNKAIWIDGGIHSREWISPAAVTFIAKSILKYWSTHPEYIQNVNWYILAVHNPDGYAFSWKNGNRFWRKNRNTNESPNPDCEGVDLNRNYDYKWGENGSSRDPCSPTFIGSFAFSEPETKAVSQFFAQIKHKFVAFFTFHSFGQNILFTKDENMSPEDLNELIRNLQEVVQNMRTINNQTYDIKIDTAASTLAQGASDGWAKSIGIKHAYTIELRDRGRYGFLLPTKQILPAAKEAQVFVWTLSKQIDEEQRKSKCINFPLKFRIKRSSSPLCQITKR